MALPPTLMLPISEVFDMLANDPFGVLQPLKLDYRRSRTEPPQLAAQRNRNVFGRHGRASGSRPVADRDGKLRRRHGNLI
jgi:hypothetical protein